MPVKLLHARGTRKDNRKDSRVITHAKNVEMKYQENGVCMCRRAAINHVCFVCNCTGIDSSISTALVCLHLAGYVDSYKFFQWLT